MQRVLSLPIRLRLYGVIVIPTYRLKPLKPLSKPQCFSSLMLDSTAL